MFLPRGGVIIDELEKLAKETEFAAGYQRVRTPHIARESLYKKSGHLPYYAESMFPPMELRAEGTAQAVMTADQAGFAKADAQWAAEFKNELALLSTAVSPEDYNNKIEQIRANVDPARRQPLENAIYTRFFSELALNKGGVDRMFLKAMNCPHHHKLFAAVPRSYRDLPLRLAEYGTCYRYEQSGELFGLMRVRSLQMNDAHIYCTPEQFEAEFNAVNEMYLKYFKLFGIDKYLMRFSTHDPSKLGQKFVDEPELWKNTEEMTRNVLKELWD